jgi:hypothetical protein
VGRRSRRDRAIFAMTEPIEAQISSIRQPDRKPCGTIKCEVWLTYRENPVADELINRKQPLKVGGSP